MSVLGIDTATTPNVYFLRPLKCVPGLLVFSLSLFSFVNARLTITPAHTEAVVGNRVQLNCSTSEPYNVQWQHFHLGTTTKQYVYFAGELVLPYSQRFVIDRDNATSRYNLIIPSVQKEDAGRYKCMDKGGSGEQAEAELIVLDSEPNCEAGSVSFCKEDTTTVEVVCSVDFVGNLAPEMDCIGSGISDFNRTTMEELHNRRVYRFQTTVLWTREKSLEMHCHTVISHISTPVSAHISYAFNTLEKQPVSHLESANCIANSSQLCSCQWIHNTTGEVSIMPDSPGTYICMAKCLLRNSAVCEVQAELLIASEGTSVSNSRSPIIIVSVFVVVLCLSIIVALAIFIIRSRWQAEGSKDPEEYQEPLNQPGVPSSQSSTSESSASQSTAETSTTYWQDDSKPIQPPVSDKYDASFPNNVVS